MLWFTLLLVGLVNGLKHFNLFKIPYKKVKEFKAAEKVDGHCCLQIYAPLHNMANKVA